MTEGEDSSPPQVQRTPFDDVVRVLGNLSLSLNAVAGRLSQLRQDVRASGISREARKAVGNDLRGLRDEFGAAAEAIDPTNGGST